MDKIQRGVSNMNTFFAKGVDSIQRVFLLLTTLREVIYSVILITLLYYGIRLYLRLRKSHMGFLWFSYYVSNKPRQDYLESISRSMFDLAQFPLFRPVEACNLTLRESLEPASWLASLRRRCIPSKFDSHEDVAAMRRNVLKLYQMGKRNPDAYDYVMVDPGRRSKRIEELQVGLKDVFEEGREKIQGDPIVQSLEKVSAVAYDSLPWIEEYAVTNYLQEDQEAETYPLVLLLAPESKFLQNSFTEETLRHWTEKSEEFSRGIFSGLEEITAGLEKWIGDTCEMGACDLQLPENRDIISQEVELLQLKMARVHIDNSTPTERDGRVIALYKTWYHYTHPPLPPVAETEGLEHSMQRVPLEDLRLAYGFLEDLVHSVGVDRDVSNAVSNVPRMSEAMAEKYLASYRAWMTKQLYEQNPSTQIAIDTAMALQIYYHTHGRGVWSEHLRDIKTYFTSFYDLYLQQRVYFSELMDLNEYRIKRTRAQWLNKWWHYFWHDRYKGILCRGACFIYQDCNPVLYVKNTQAQLSKVVHHFDAWTMDLNNFFSQKSVRSLEKVRSAFQNISLG